MFKRQMKHYFVTKMTLPAADKTLWYDPQGNEIDLLGIFEVQQT